MPSARSVETLSLNLEPAEDLRKKAVQQVLPVPYLETVVLPAGVASECRWKAVVTVAVEVPEPIEAPEVPAVHPFQELPEEVLECREAVEPREPTARKARE